MKKYKIRQIAESVNLLANLPKGDALVHLIGNGNEASNLEALGSWVQEQEDLLLINRPDHRVEQLIFRLKNRLNDFCEVVYY